MIDLFPGPALLATRTHPDYEFTAGTQVLATTRQRSVDPKHWLRYVLRLLISRHATRHAEMEILDPAGVPRLIIALDAGEHNRFAANLRLTDGTPIGRAAAHSGIFSPFPEIQLSDAAGRRLGHLTTNSGAPQAYAADGRLIAELTWTPEPRPFAKPAFTLRFLRPGLPAELRALIVAGLIAWELPR